MKLFNVPGGVHPKDHKELSADRAIQAVPMPVELSLPMHQHIGIAAKPMVQVGELVTKGQLIGMCTRGAASNNGITAPVHAPTSGRITNIAMQRSPHPSGLPEMMVTLEPDGADAWGELPAALDPASSSVSELVERIHRSGIVGMGGAMFPTAAKLDARNNVDLLSLIINGAECEPYLTADDRLMRERARNIVDGISILQRILNVPNVIIAIEDRRVQAADAMSDATGAHKGMSVVLVPTLYPMGSEKHLIKVLTGEEVPSGALPSALGLVVNNVGTAYAIHEAVRYGQPLVSRIVTVSGGAIKHPGNYHVLLGTKVSHLVETCGGFSQPPEQMLIGGPMMGLSFSDLEVPITKGTNGILALTKSEVKPGTHRPCIRCGACIPACPSSLEPQDLFVLVRNEKIEPALDAGLADCILCGACSYVCPSHIPLVQFFNYGKGQALEMRNEVMRAARLKRLSDERLVRSEEKARQKKAKQDARKKAIADRKKAHEQKYEGEVKA
ncbi:MAG: electron transport complex subunit RsxC [bacterium]|nr:electron transport complex subunit RsxC [bacterium]